MLNFAYCSDKYQYTMGKSFYDSGMKDQHAVFNMFYRKAPENNNWAVVIGVIGMAGCGVNYPIYSKMLKNGKKKYAFEIVELARQISEE